MKKTNPKKILNAVMEALCPDACVGCGEPLGRAGDRVFCPACRKKYLNEISAPCPSCGKSYDLCECRPKNFLPGLLSPILPLSFKFCPWPLRGGYFSSPRFCFDSRSTAQLIAIVGSASVPASTDRTASAASVRIGWPSVLFFIWLSRLLYAPHLICTINYATRGLYHVSHTLSTE